jgi:hypothetical protein
MEGWGTLRLSLRDAKFSAPGAPNAHTPVLPATIAIKHQIRMRMAQDEIKKAEVETRHEALHGQSSKEQPDTSLT